MAVDRPVIAFTPGGGIMIGTQADVDAAQTDTDTPDPTDTTTVTDGLTELTEATLTVEFIPKS